MAEATPSEGTSNLSIHQAVENLLAAEAPPPEDTQVSEEPVAEEAPVEEPAAEEEGKEDSK